MMRTRHQRHDQPEPQRCSSQCRLMRVPTPALMAENQQAVDGLPHDAVDAVSVRAP